MSDIRILTREIKKEAQRLGFSLAGVTSPDPPDHLDFYQNWIENGYQGTMGWMATDRALERRSDPRQILPECKSILVLGTDYPAPSSDPGQNQIAAYAVSGNDYHLVLKDKLIKLIEFIEQSSGEPIPNRWYTDTGAILERELGVRAGLGWIGKNTCLIHPRRGSYFFLAEILLGIELETDPPFNTTHCGNCTRCLEACPTGCLEAPRTLNASRCISYLTIEYRDLIPEDLRPQIGNQIFGCDICQQVCPWNQRFGNEREILPEFQAVDSLQNLNPMFELQLSEEEFQGKYQDSPMKRTKRWGYLRNIAVALGNQKFQEAVPALQEALNDSEMLIRAHAAWALGEIGGDQSLAALKTRLAVENNAQVQAEISLALKNLSGKNGNQS
jgi:epoxyqueuosine reductase